MRPILVAVAVLVLALPSQALLPSGSPAVEAPEVPQKPLAVLATPEATPEATSAAAPPSAAVASATSLAPSEAPTRKAALADASGSAAGDFAPPPPRPGPSETTQPTRAPTPQAAGGYGQMEFRCPEGPAGTLPQQLPGGNAIVVHGCPIRVYDQGYSFGNPGLRVNPDDAREAAFFSLHGPPARDGATERSRSGLTHTAFVSHDQGLSWSDQFYSPQHNREGHGESASGTMDAAGNIYIAYTWSFDNASSLVGLFKAPPAREGGGVVDSYDYPYWLTPRQPGWMDEVRLVHLPAHTPERARDETEGNGTQAPTTEEDNLRSADAGLDHLNATPERVVAVWHERPVDWANSTTGMSAWIDAAWSHTGAAQEWERLGAAQLVGPCRTASNAVAHDGKVYVACVVEAGYDHRPRARVGQIDLWEIDVHTGNTTLLGDTGLVGGRPLLAVNDEGYMVLVSYRKQVDEGRVVRLEVDAAYSWHGGAWSRVGADMGLDLRRLGGGDRLPLLDADITGLAITSRPDPTAFLVYKEWRDEPQDVEGGVDPDDPFQVLDEQFTDFTKYLVAFDACTFPLAAARMQLGMAVDVTNADAYSQQPGVFNDRQDGLQAYREPGGGQLVYFAINDYGSVQYGAVVAESVRGLGDTCPQPPPIPAIPPAAIPQALSLANPYSWVAGAAVGASAVAMVLYLLLVKRRAPHALAAEDE